MSQLQSFLKSLAIAMTLMASSPAFALTITNLKPDTIALNGPIEVGDGTKFIAFLMAAVSSHGITAVSIASPGGSVGDAITIGTVIHRLGLKTIIFSGTECTSACPFIWIAGTPREVHGGIGLHHPYTLDFQPSSAISISMFREYWLRMNGPAEVFDKGMDTPMTSMTMFTPEEMNGASPSSEPLFQPASAPPPKTDFKPAVWVIRTGKGDLEVVPKPIISRIEPEEESLIPVKPHISKPAKRRLEAHERQKAN
jgi:hypothetical protein